MVEIGSTEANHGLSGASGDRFVAPTAQMETGEAAALARSLYGIDGEAERLTSERDVNFRIRARTGDQYVLKLAHPAEPEAAIAFQNRALLHLEAADPGLPAPRVVRTPEGRDYVRVDGRLTRLLSWLDGPLMHQRSVGAALRRDLGNVHARLHRALSALAPPEASAPLLWDLQHMAQLEPLIARVDPDRRRLVEQALERHRARVAPVLAKLPAQVIHNDLNQHNVVVSENGAAVAGIIDFGDMVYAPRACDVAIAAAYHVTGEGDPLAEASEYVSAYQRAFPLLDEAELLTDLIVSRMAMTVLITSWRATLHPDNSAYILRNAPRAWAGLQAIVPGDRRLEIVQ